MFAPILNRGEHASMSQEEGPVSETLESPGALSGSGYHGGYQPPPAYAVPLRPAVPEINVGDAVTWAWSRTLAHPLIIAWIPLTILVMGVVLGGAFSLIGEEDGSLNAAIGVPAVLIWALIMHLGLQSAALWIAHGKKVTFRSLIAPPNGLDAAAALVLVGLASAVASIVPFGGLVVGYFFWVAVAMTMNERCSCFKAIGRSCRLMKQGGNAPLLMLVLVLVHIAGVLTVIGLLVTIPMIHLLTVYVYMRMSGGEVAR